MRLFRTVIIITTLFALQNIATLLIPFMQPSFRIHALPLAGLSVTVGFALLPLSAPFLWFLNKIGLYILTLGTLLVFVGSMFIERTPSIPGILIQSISFSLFHFLLLFVTLATFHNRSVKIQAEQDAAANP
jgi:hypothetical protein